MVEQKRIQQKMVEQKRVEQKLLDQVVPVQIFDPPKFRLHCRQDDLEHADEVAVTEK
jgi:hypothetical protein